MQVVQCKVINMQSESLDEVQLMNSNKRRDLPSVSNSVVTFCLLIIFVKNLNPDQAGQKVLLSLETPNDVQSVA